MADKTLLSINGFKAIGLAEVLTSFFSWLVWGLVSFVSGVAASAISIIAKPKASANNFEAIDFRFNIIHPNCKIHGRIYGKLLIKPYF